MLTRTLKTTTKHNSPAKTHSLFCGNMDMELKTWSLNLQMYYISIYMTPVARNPLIFSLYHLKPTLKPTHQLLERKINPLREETKKQKLFPIVLPEQRFPSLPSCHQLHRFTPPPPPPSFSTSVSRDGLTTVLR